MLVTGLSITPGLVGIGAVERDQLVELLAHQVGTVLDTRVDQGAHRLDVVLLGQRQHLGLSGEVTLKGRGEGFVQGRLLGTRRHHRIRALSLLDLIHQYADARLGFLERRRFAVDQYPKGQNAQAQNVFCEVTEVFHTG